MVQIANEGVLEKVLQEYKSPGKPRIEAYCKKDDSLKETLYLDAQYMAKLIDIFGIQSEEDCYCYGYDINEGHQAALLSHGIIAEKLDLNSFCYQFFCLHPMYIGTKFERQSG